MALYDFLLAGVAKLDRCPFAAPYDLMKGRAEALQIFARQIPHSDRTTGAGGFRLVDRIARIGTLSVRLQHPEGGADVIARKRCE